jgi:uncharacterized protein YjdB
MATWGKVAAALGAVAVMSGCGGGDGGTDPDCDPIAAAIVERIEVTPATATLTLGDSLQLAARAFSCAGAMSGLPPFEWQSANASAVPVSATGMVRAVSAAGSVRVTASVQGKSGAATISSQRIPVASVRVEPATASIGLGRTSTLTARAFDAQGRELTGRAATWSTSNGAIVSVTQQGQITGLAVGGPVTVTATIEGQSGSSAVRVVRNPVGSVTVAPPSASIAGGQTVQLAATVRDDIGATVTDRAVAWTSSDETVATVSTTGLVTGRRAGGPVTITATSEERSGTSQVTVTVGQPARLVFLSQPDNVTLGATLPTVTVEVQDAAGNRVTTSGAAITLALAPSGTLGGTRTRNAVNGVAAFDDLTVGAAGTFTLVASAAGGLTGTSGAFIVSVPAVTITTTTLPAATRNSPYSQQLAATGGTGTFAWSLAAGSTLPAGISLSGSGVLSGTPTTAGSTTFTVTATSGGQSDTQQLTLVVNQPGVTITTTTLPAGTRGVPYSQQLAATGGDGSSYAWTVQNGTLPAGLTLSATGLLSGTPTAAGSSTFTVRVTSGGQNDTQSLTVVISNPAVQVTTTTLPAATRGTAYSQTLAATGGDGTFTWALAPGSGPLPTGVTLSSAGVLSGTPTTATTYNFTVRATSAGQSDDQALTLVVNNPGVVITTSTLPAATLGTAYSTTLAATGGTGTFTWALAPGSDPLPTGVTLSSAGVLGGTPTQSGSFPITVRATSGAQSADRALTLVVNVPAVTITTTTLPQATFGSPYSAPLAATGGDGTYAWTLAAGNLPGGINISNAGVLSGTPTESGSFAITVRVTSGAQTDEQALTLVVAVPAVTITTATLPGGQQGTPYTATLAATGGTGTFTWTVASGTLPTGLSLSPDGQLTGTPTTAATYNFTLRATSGPQSDTQAYSVTIAPLPGVRLGFVTVPATATAGVATTVTVEVLNAQDQRVTTSTAPVTLALGANPGAGTLSGGGPVAAASGLATFSNVVFSAAGNGYTLVATSGSLLGDTSVPIDVAAAAGTVGTRLGFLVQPSTVDEGAVISPAVQVQVLDANGVRVTGGTFQVRMSLATNPGGSTLTGTLQRGSVNGVATFNDLRLNNASTGYRLLAQATGLTSATSNAFRVQED